MCSGNDVLPVLVEVGPPVPVDGLVGRSHLGDEVVLDLPLDIELCEDAGIVTIKSLSELPSFKENTNQVLSVSLLMTSSTALANEGLFELTWCPSLTWAVSSSFAETTEEPGCKSGEKAKVLSNFGHI